jgi:hypothetical protein
MLGRNNQGHFIIASICLTVGKKTITVLEELIVGMSDNLASTTTKLGTMEGLLNMELEESKSLNTEKKPSEA